MFGAFEGITKPPLASGTDRFASFGTASHLELITDHFIEVRDLPASGIIGAAPAG
jgi:hypothetical protein